MNTLSRFYRPHCSKAPALGSQSGVALVLTLIMLAVITFMAIAFLVISRGEKSNATTSTDQALARLAADAALERAQAQLLAPMLAASNEFNFDVLISTNFINPYGFVPGNSDPTNVNFDYKKDGSKLSSTLDREQNIANLLFDPRPPVFVITNRNLGSNDFRYYLDLNRNGAFEPTGWLRITNELGNPTLATDGSAVSSYFTGDPQWIGALEFPDRPHSAANRFIYRYAYIVLPTGKTLDINYIHDYSKFFTPYDMTRGDGFYRNQGVAPWEINLAAFLVDLNTNMWPFPKPGSFGAAYNYSTDVNLANTGAAFDDAVALLRYRYTADWSTLKSISQLFGNALPFRDDLIDGYSAGPLMVGTCPPPSDPDTLTRIRLGWAGADNTNHFFTAQDFFDKSKTARKETGPLTFTDRLFMAATNKSSYDRYTFYRLLSQLGTDSEADSPEKVNVNYINTHAISATNFISWNTTTNPAIAALLGRPGSEVFFTNAVDKLLRAQGFPFRVTAIPVFTNNIFVYSPSVHRLLQLAANIYDASSSTSSGFPTVFRPKCRTIGNAVYITDFEEITNKVTQLDWRRTLDLPSFTALTNVTPNDLIYGVPLVVGAKKGLPNLNEVAMQCVVEMTRKLELTRLYPSSPRSSWRTNVMYVMTITNALGVEAWNSYQSNYTRPVDVFVTNLLTMTLTNETGRSWVITNRPYGNAWSIGLYGSFWPGIGPAANNPNLHSLLVPMRTNIVFLPASVYRFGTATFTTNLNIGFERVSGFPIPHWGLAVANRVQFIIVDHFTQRIIDYVHLTSIGGTRDLSQEIADQDFALSFDGMWSTNRLWNDPINGPPQGFVNQIYVCLDPANDSIDWTSYGPFNQASGETKQKELDDFRLFYFGDKRSQLTTVQVPFSPTVRVAQYLTWQANDPLVHYTAGDLNYAAGGSGLIKEKRFKNLKPLLPNIGQINDRYSPWGGNRLKTGGADASADPNLFNLAVKDPLVTSSDAWDFPTNKLPNIGWLGRVHRGTPWQTVYLKSADIAATPAGLQSWKDWTGNVDNNDALRTAPVDDRRLLDVFTTAFNDNASRGRLSINQTNLAAWSAVLSGVVALQPSTNADLSHPPTNFAWTVIQPAGALGTNSPVCQIVTAMNDIRRTNYSGSFKALGDFLAVPEFTTNSPFLGPLTQQQRNWGVTDEVYERLPQQILGLLSCDHTPRFVVYSYGQSLKPAPRSIVTSGQFFGLCTNYQITAEVATRAVIRVDGAPTNSHSMLESFNLMPPD